MAKLIDLTDQRFGRLTVIRRGPNTKQFRAQWYCKCDCGNIKLIVGICLRNGTTISCSCYKNEIHRKHGDFGTRFYNVWAHMKYRCNNPNDKYYKDYGGRGISYDSRWEDYINFKEDMYKSYLLHKQTNGTTTLERTNNNGNYEPSNCKWSTQQEQSSNTRRNKLFIGIYTIPGPSYGYREVDLNQNEFARKYNLNRRCINSCLRNEQTSHKGWKFKYILKED